LLEVKRTTDGSLPTSSRTAIATGRNGQRKSSAVDNSHDEDLSPHDVGRVGPVLLNDRNRIPVIIGEAHFKGVMPVNGVLTGHLRKNGSSLEVRQKANSELRSQPDLSGQLSFTDLVRINGHIAGTVYSKNGTLIVDSGASVDANVDVEVAIIRGTVNGDIIAQKRVELAAGAKVFGNIWTRSLAVDAGATFDGDCNMLQES
jgi:cytoskeletal protein CcmA (bactofilin family)